MRSRCVLVRNAAGGKERPEEAEEEEEKEGRAVLHRPQGLPHTAREGLQREVKTGPLLSSLIR